MTTANRTSDDDIARIVRLYQLGVPVKEIAALVKCSERTVTRWVRDAGIPYRANINPLSPDDLVEAEKMLDDGASYQETARTLGCGVAVLTRRFPGRGWTKKQTWEFIHDVRRAKKVLGD